MPKGARRMQEIVLSCLGHTWVLDLDGTIVKHNGYKIDGKDSLLPGAKEFINRLPEKDMVVFLTSRTNEYKEQTIEYLNNEKIRYDHIIFNAPYGERIIVNDRKPSGLEMSKAVNVNRDKELNLKIIEDPKK